MNYTPGPWEVVKFSTVVNHEIRTRVAEVNGRDAEERADNARLISAALDLLEACRTSLLEHVALHEVMLLNPIMRGTKEPAIIPMLRAAIAKAEGVNLENGTASEEQTLAGGENK